MALDLGGVAWKKSDILCLPEARHEKEARRGDFLQDHVVETDASYMPRSLEALCMEAGTSFSLLLH
jgi:hypothetical protein